MLVVVGVTATAMEGFIGGGTVTLLVVPQAARARQARSKNADRGVREGIVRIVSKLAGAWATGQRYRKRGMDGERVGRERVGRRDPSGWLERPALPKGMKRDAQGRTRSVKVADMGHSDVMSYEKSRGAWTLRDSGKAGVQ